MHKRFIRNIMEGIRDELVTKILVYILTVSILLGGCSVLKSSQNQGEQLDLELQPNSSTADAIEENDVEKNDHLQQAKFDAMSLMNNISTSYFWLDYHCVMREVHTEERLLVAYSYYYKPVIQNGDECVRAKINMHFDDECESFFAQGNRLTYFRANVQERLFEEALEFVTRGESAGQIIAQQPYRVTVDIQLLNNDDKYVSFSKYVYSLNLKGSFRRIYGVTFDSQTGEICTLAELISNSEEMNEINYEHLFKQEFSFLNSDEIEELVQHYNSIDDKSIEFFIKSGELYLLINYDSLDIQDYLISAGML